MEWLCDIDWFDNPNIGLSAVCVLGELVRISVARRSRPLPGPPVSTVTLTFNCDALVLRVYKTFTRSYRPGSKLNRFIAALTECPPEELNNPFLAHRLLVEQIGKRFLLRCVERERGQFLEIEQAVPVE